MLSFLGQIKIPQVLKSCQKSNRFSSNLNLHSEFLFAFFFFFSTSINIYIKAETSCGVHEVLPCGALYEYFFVQPFTSHLLINDQFKPQMQKIKRFGSTPFSNFLNSSTFNFINLKNERFSSFNVSFHVLLYIYSSIRKYQKAKRKVGLERQRDRVRLVSKRV